MGDGFEQALHASVQRIVLERLPVRAVRCLRQRIAVLHEARMTPAPVAPAILQIIVQRQIHPAWSQSRQIGLRAAGQFAQVLRAQQRMTIAAQRLGKFGQGGIGRCDSGHGGLAEVVAEIVAENVG